MPRLGDLWQLLRELNTSLPFAMALPLAVAIALATLVDWIERRLTEHREAIARAPDQAWAPHQEGKQSGVQTRTAAVSMRQTAGRF